MVPDFRTILVPIFGAFFAPRYWNSHRKSKNGPKLGTKMVPENGTIFGFRGPDFAAHPARIPRPGALALAIHCGAVFLSIAKHLLCRFHNISIILLFLRVRIFEIYFVAIENLHGSIVGNRSHDGRGVGVVFIRIILFYR